MIALLAAAVAGPFTTTFQTRVLDDLGVPVDTTADVRLRLYDSLDAA